MYLGMTTPSIAIILGVAGNICVNERSSPLERNVPATIIKKLSPFERNGQLKKEKVNSNGTFSSTSIKKDLSQSDKSDEQEA